MDTNLKKPILGILVPCFNEGEIINYSAEALLSSLNGLIHKNLIHEKSFLGFIDDGSSDNTWESISALAKRFPTIKGIKLSTNQGHQFALLAGLQTFRDQADALITIDADLQDDISVIEQMVQQYLEGSDIVYGVRAKRSADSFFKRHSAEFYYKFAKFFKVPVITNHADFRLISQRVARILDQFSESNVFLRGLFPSMGFKNSIVYYERKERKKGVSKYPFFKMVSFAWDGVSSFSVRPLHLLTVIGVIIFLLSLIGCVFAVFSFLYLKVVPGWASIVLPMYLLGGIQLLAVGIIGEYLGKMYREVKRRPRYIIEEVIK
jgi:glycosyltransferase involved in cell wall biosynthesis